MIWLDLPVKEPMLLNRTVAVYRPGQQVRLKQKMVVFSPEKGGQVDISDLKAEGVVGQSLTRGHGCFVRTQFLLLALEAIPVLEF